MYKSSLNDRQVHACCFGRGMHLPPAIGSRLGLYCQINSNIFRCEVDLDT